ncbi:hypothetical protein [Streptomyces sp. enrichment culture]|uniref:hypothetical protein n=1 Tax=Streptomyces sp. enrichment culture TaxID=1795815 RepID=UPI003F556EB9
MEDADRPDKAGSGPVTGVVGEIGEIEFAGDNPEPGPAGETGDIEGAARRPRGRTTLMIAAAAVLGVVAGTCAGYLIQAERPPTALPPLSQPVVPQAKAEAEPLPASRDRQVRMDGDLREFLIDRPKNARDVDDVPDADGWVGLSEYAKRYEDPASTFAGLVADDFRRSASVSWAFDQHGGVYINLTQFRQVSTMGASLWAENGFYWADRETDTRSWPIPGTGEHAGTAYVHDTPERKAGYLPLYSAEAHAWRGDVYVEIFIYDTKPVPKAKIMDLAKRQVGKL